jgi:hypothetical protein
MFQVKKCGKEECPFCWPVKSSADVFTKLIKFKPHPQLARDENGVVVKDPCTDKQSWRSLEDLYFNNNNNTEEDRPMFRHGPAGQYEDSQVSTLLNKERVGSFVICTLCNKRRCLYKRTNISLNREIRERIQRCKEEILYTCGSNFVSMSDPTISQELVVVRRALQCITVIERQYYTEFHEPICCHCGSEFDEECPQVLPQELMYEWQMVLPICTNCKGQGLENITRGKRKNPHLAAQKRKSYEMKTPSTTKSRHEQKRSKHSKSASASGSCRRRRLVIEDCDDTSTEGSGEDEQAQQEQQQQPGSPSIEQEADSEADQLELTDDRPAHIKVASECDKREHQGKVVQVAVLLVTDADSAESSGDAMSLYCAVVTSTPENRDRKVSISYINDEEENSSNANRMVFTETTPVYTDAVWYRDIKYIMPTGRVTKHEIEGEEDEHGNQKYEYHVDVSGGDEDLD